LDLLARHDAYPGVAQQGYGILKLLSVSPDTKVL
jgi:hypothetical protein